MPENPDKKQERKTTLGEGYIGKRPIELAEPQGNEIGEVQPDYDGVKRRLPEEESESHGAQSGGDPAASAGECLKQRINPRCFPPCFPSRCLVFRLRSQLTPAVSTPNA